ncbi:MAG: hypothetical protein ABL927_05865 [Bdellovibrionales bacterium]
MAFEELLNKPTHESVLLEQFVAHIQANYLKYQTEFYFLKLDLLADKTVQIVWVKTFADEDTWGDYFYDTVFERACILLKFEKERYELLIHGFQVCDRFKIWPNKIEGSEPINMTWNLEERKMISREILEGAFGEIADNLSEPKSSIPI